MIVACLRSPRQLEISATLRCVARGLKIGRRNRGGRHSALWHVAKTFWNHAPLVSFHEHNEAMRTAQPIERIVAGENLALVSDAGTPGLSDPAHV